MNIFKAYRGAAVLKGASVSLEPGERVALAGKNGSGKSTLMRVIAQRLRPDSGSVELDGRSVARDREFLRKRLGYIPQECELAEFLTVKQQLELWRAAVGAEYPEADELLGLGELMKKRISELSGGQRKRVSIALAIQSRPDYLVADEAFASLDAEYRERFAAWMRSRCEDGMAVLWCTHDAQELRRMCGRAVLLDGGVTRTVSADEAVQFLSEDGRNV